MANQSKMFEDVLSLGLYECLERHPSPKVAMKQQSYQVFPPIMVCSQEPSEDPRSLLFDLRRNPYNKNLYAITNRNSKSDLVPQTLVITDTKMHPKKGWFPKRSSKKFCVKHLRGRTIHVFNVEWMPRIPEVKKEDMDQGKGYYWPSTTTMEK